MITREQHLLIKLSEEAVEVALELSKRIHKTMLFGLNETNVKNPNGPNNREAIINELNDLYGIVEMLVDEGTLPKDWFSEEKIQARKEKVERYMEHARNVGNF
jgi:phosphoribosyl-ATP pyrophosphohydrolase